MVDKLKLSGITIQRGLCVTIMKRTILILAALAFLYQGCTHDLVNRKYILYNGTGHEVKVELYREGNLLTSSSSVGSGVIDERTVDDERGPLSAVNAFFGMDSVVVTYNNDKRQTYFYSDTTDTIETIPVTEHNPLLDSGYEIINNELYRFTFTKADYENAEEIGG